MATYEILSKYSHYSSLFLAIYYLPGRIFFAATTTTYGTLPGVQGINTTNTTGIASFDNSSAIPTVVRCTAGKPCKVPILFHGNVSNP